MSIIIVLKFCKFSRIFYAQKSILLIKRIRIIQKTAFCDNFVSQKTVFKCYFNLNFYCASCTASSFLLSFLSKVIIMITAAATTTTPPAIIAITTGEIPSDPS